MEQIKQVEAELLTDMNDLVKRIKEATGTKENFVREQIFRVNPETRETEGFCSAKLLAYEEELSKIDDAVEDFKLDTERGVFIKSSYMGPDVDVYSVTVALGVNGPEDYVRLKEAEKKSGKAFN